MTSASPFTPAERIESLKASIWGGLCAGLVSLLLVVMNRSAHPATVPPIAALFSGLAGLALLITAAIAALSGALFALTYRYAIRQDHNPQLNAGVVLAFTLVRGLAQVDAGSAIAQNFWPFLAACIESGLIFGSTAIGLNLAFQQKWLKRFGHESDQAGR